jgi:type I restriction enzyme S subunit
MVLIRPKPDLLNFRFLRYWLNSPALARHTHGHRDGSVAERLNLPTIRGLPIAIPPLPYQELIADVLGSLDDKIEQNRRTSRALERLARAIFRAWFVDFEPIRAKAAGDRSFPGMPPAVFAALPARLADSDLGPIPEGWEVGHMGAVGVPHRQQVAPEEIENGTPYIALEHMPRRCIALQEWGTADAVTSAKSRFKTGDILFGKLRPYFHKVGPAPVDGVCSTDIVVLSAKKPKWSAWLLMLVSSDEFVSHTDQTSAGTKMPRTTWGDMARFPVALPPDDLAKAFQDVAEPMLALVRSGIHESRKLAAVRDSLLPKLLSGAVRVRL